MKTFYAYVHLRPDGSPFYVGKGSRYRAKYFGEKAGRSIFHQNVVNKYGQENVGVAIYHCADEAHAFKMECSLIAMFKDWGHELVNHTAGGEGASGYVFSPELRKQRTATRLKRYAEDPELKERATAKFKAYARSPENKAHMVALGLKARGSVWLTKDQKNVYTHEASKYLMEGWVRGKFNKNKSGPKPKEKIEVVRTGSIKSMRNSAPGYQTSEFHAKMLKNLEHTKSPEVQLKKSLSSKGQKWLAKGAAQIKVKPQEVEKYLAEGWVPGRIKGVPRPGARKVKP